VPSPYTLEDARGWIALAAIERERETVLHVVAVRESDDLVVGAGALRLQGEVGYWVAADARRSGIGSRVVELLTRFAFEALAFPYVEIVISPENEASLRVARRCGYAEQRRELREFKGELVEFAIYRRAAGQPDS
jgi:RimJ/RimL family protein N-acetyltransferase